MNPAPASSPRFLGLTAKQAAILLITLATVFRLYYCTWLPMLPDETYYFQWSHHLDASYFSKGPAVAYTIAAGTALFGENNFGVRFFAVMLSAGTAWQIFLLARRWYDDTAALLAVLLAGVIPLYAVGAVLMTIDPLSAFFWVWAANFFSAALQSGRLSSWLWTGFAVGSGFLAKYLNALELLAFFAFLLLVPARRVLLLRPGFWLMLGTFLFCTLPVVWWNSAHHWASATQLSHRGQLEDGLHLSLSTLANFFLAQAVVVSPLLFLAFLGIAISVANSLLRRKAVPGGEGELLLLLLFAAVFLFYAVLAFHLRCEPNWPAVSYLTLLIVLAGHWREILASLVARRFLAIAFCLAWLETVILHNPSAVHLPAHLNPMGRTAGWPEIASEMDHLRQREKADILVADGYKEASALAFYLPQPAFVYAVRHEPPANQFDLWAPFPSDSSHRILWIADYDTPARMRGQFTTILPLERIEIHFGHKLLRQYYVFLCQNGSRP